MRSRGLPASVEPIEPTPALAPQPLPTGTRPDDTPSSSSSPDLEPLHATQRARLDAAILRELRRRQRNRRMKGAVLAAILLAVGLVAFFYPHLRVTCASITGAAVLLVIRQLYLQPDIPGGGKQGLGRVPFSSAMNLLRLGSGAAEGRGIGPSPRLAYLRQLKAEKAKDKEAAKKTRFGVEDHRENDGSKTD